MCIGKTVPTRSRRSSRRTRSILVVFGMVSSDMYNLTQALQGVFTGPKLTDMTNNKTGPAFADFDRMEDFWQVRGKEQTGNLQSCRFSAFDST